MWISLFGSSVKHSNRQKSSCGLKVEVGGLPVASIVYTVGIMEVPIRYRLEQQTVGMTIPADTYSREYEDAVLTINSAAFYKPIEVMNADADIELMISPENIGRMRDIGEKAVMLDGIMEIIALIQHSGGRPMGEDGLPVLFEPKKQASQRLFTKAILPLPHLTNERLSLAGTLAMLETSRLLAGDTQRSDEMLRHIFADVERGKAIILQLGAPDATMRSYNFDSIGGSRTELLAGAILTSEMQLICLSGLIAITNTMN